jgi:hypothetical protein
MKNENEVRAAAFLVTAAECIALTLGMNDAETAELQDQVRRDTQKGGKDENEEAA